MAEGALREGRACGVGCFTLGALDDAEAVAGVGFGGCRSNEAATAARSVSSKSSSITIIQVSNEAENWWVEL